MTFERRRSVRVSHLCRSTPRLRRLRQILPLLAGLGWTGLGMAIDVDAAQAQAQARTPDRESWGFVGVHLGGARPLGEFGELVDAGFVIQGTFSAPIALDRRLSLRLDMGAVVYGNERETLCFPPPIGCRIGVDLTTTNSIATVAFGPELSGRGPVAPYVHGGIGFSYFATTSSLSGVDDIDDQNLFETRNYGDLVGQVRLGGGVRFEVARSSGGPVMIDLGVEYHGNGIAEYLREGDIVDFDDGSIQIFPNRTEANLLEFRVGVTFGIGGEGYREEKRKWAAAGLE
jgi:hypothetical protein